MKSKHAILLVLIILLGGIFLTKAFGVWSTESTRLPKLTESGDYDPGDIRGSYSFKDIENAFSIKSETLARAFSLELEDPETFSVKGLEGIYGEVIIQEKVIEIGTAAVRYFISLYSGIESKLVEPTYLPQTALEILLEEKKIAQEDEAFNWAVDLGQLKVEQEALIEVKENEEAPLIKGNTTVAELLDRGFSIEELERLMGISIEQKGQIIRDLCVEHELSFQEVKTKIAEFAEEMEYH